MSKEKCLITMEKIPILVKIHKGRTKNTYRIHFKLPTYSNSKPIEELSDRSIPKNPHC